MAAEEKERLRIVRTRGKDERVKPARIAAIVETGGPVPGPDRAEHERAAAHVRGVERRLRGRTPEVEVRLLWEIAREADGLRSGSDAAAQPIAELAELALGCSTGEACSIMLLALVEEGLHFVRRGDGWAPRQPAAVAALRDERERASRQAAEASDCLDRLAGAVRDGRFERRDTEPERRYLEALEWLALHGDEAPQAMRATALQAIEAAGSRGARPQERAFRLLRSIGRFATDDVNLQVLRFGLRTGFPAIVLQHAAERAERPFDREGRTDLVDLFSISVDGPHTVEIDDLLSVERRAAAGFRLGVHIADPTAFVEPDDSLDREALARGVTHYMPDMRLPMLPPAISERAASLVAGEERPALTFFADLDAEGEVAGFEIVASIVRSTRRLSYAEADRSMAAADDDRLAALAEVGRLRQRSRIRAGALVIEAPEVDVHLDERGTPFLERIEAESPSRVAVAEAMVLAGRLAARYCIEAGLPAIYRRQAPPAPPPAGAGAVVRDPVAVRRARRSLRRAETGLEPGPHAGLGFSAYVQASSPLRRYQDLALHRQIVSRLRGRAACYDAEALRRIAATTERAEADARRAEQAAGEYWLLRHLERFAGRTVEGIVVEVEPRPIVQLVETLLEQPVRGLAGVEPGQTVRLVVVEVVPRAGLLSLRPLD